MTATTGDAGLSLIGDESHLTITGSTLELETTYGIGVTGDRTRTVLHDAIITSNSRGSGVAFGLQGDATSLTASGASALTAHGQGLAFFNDHGPATPSASHLELDGFDLVAAGEAVILAQPMDATSRIANSTVVGESGVVPGYTSAPWEFGASDTDRFSGHLTITHSTLVAQIAVPRTGQETAALVVRHAPAGGSVIVEHSSLQAGAQGVNYTQVGLPVLVAPSPAVAGLKLAITASNLAGAKAAGLRAVRGFPSDLTTRGLTTRGSAHALGLDLAALNLDGNYWGGGLSNLDAAAVNSVVLTAGNGRFADQYATPLLAGRPYTYFKTLTASGLYRCEASGACTAVPVDDVEPEAVPPDPPAVVLDPTVVTQGLVEPALTATWPTKATTGQAVAVDVAATADGVTPAGTVTVRLTGTRRVAGHATMSAGRARINLGKLAAGSYTATVTYAGSETVAGAQRIIGPLTVVKAKATVTVKAPRRVKAGKRARLRITVKAPGLTKVTGKVRIKATGKGLKRRAVSRVTLKGAKATVRLPRAVRPSGAAQPRIRVTIRYLGSATAKAATVKTVIRVRRPAR
jgi:hypothetical protein